MYKPNNLSPKSSAVDINDPLIFSWDSQEEPQTDYRVRIYNNNTSVLIHDSTQITSSDEYYQYVDTASFLGESWTETTNGDDGTFFYEIKNIGNGVLLSGKIEALQRSTDYGITWTTILENTNQYYYSIAYYENIVIVGSLISADASYILRSEDYGQTWVSINLDSIGLTYSNVLLAAEYVGNGVFLVGVSSYLIRSNDYGQTWENLGVLDNMSSYVHSIENLGDGIVVVGTKGNIFRSTDYGKTWTDLGQQTFSSSSYISRIEKLSSSIVIACTEDVGVSILYSDDVGLTWIRISTSVTSSYVEDLSNIGDGLVFGISYADKKLLKSTNYGQNWTVVTTDYPTGDYGKCLESTNTNLILGYNDSPSGNNKTYYSSATLSITNGNDYKWYVQTYSATDDQDSYYEYFKTSTKPSISFSDPVFSATPLTLTTQDYTFQATYSQAESVTIKKYKIILYDKDYITEIINTNWVYDFNISYDIEGMLSEQYYYIECIVESQDGIQNTTGKKEFYVDFALPSVINDLVITENNNNGNVTVEWGDLARNLGIALGTTSYTTGVYGQALDITTENVFFNIDYNLEYYTLHTLVKPDSLFNGAILNLDDDIEFGYNSSLSQFYWDDSDVTYSDTATFSNGYWYLISICAGGNIAYPVQIVIQRYDSTSEILTDLVTMNISTSKLC